MADKKISQLSGASTPLAGTEVLPIVQSGSTVKVSAENLVKATQPGSTAKTIPYLNASKVPTSGVELQFDGANLGVGVAPTVPSQGISIEMAGGTCVYSRTQAGIPQTYISSNAVGTGYSAVYKQNGYAAQYVFQGFDGTHAWYTAASGVAGAPVTFTERFGISNAGNVTVNTGNLVVGTAGKGIDFSANGGDVLTQYDEGTWVPVATSITINSGTPVWSGTYTRIGRMVVLQWALSGGANIDVSLSSYLSIPFTALGNSWGSYGNVATNAHIGGIVTYGASLYFGTAAAGISSASGVISIQI